MSIYGQLLRFIAHINLKTYPINNLINHPKYLTNKKNAGGELMKILNYSKGLNKWQR